MYVSMKSSTWFNIFFLILAMWTLAYHIVSDHVYDLLCIRLIYFGGFVIYLKFIYYRKLWNYVLYYELGRCPQSGY